MVSHTQSEIEDWIANYVGGLLGVSKDAVDRNAELDALGIDSAAAIALVGDLENWLQTELETTMVYDHSTVKALSAAIATGS